MTNPRRARAVLLAAATALLPACSTAVPPATVVHHAAPPPEKIDPGASSVQSDIGGLNEEAMEHAFAALEVQRCLTEGNARLSEIGGEFKLRMRINRLGGARWAYLSESTLG